jgi:hypothetical protein
MADPAAYRQFLQRVALNDAINLGMVSGVIDDVKFGHCPNAQITPTDVWELGATIPVYVFPPDAGETIEAVSDNIADVGVKVTWEGLSPAGAPQAQEVTLNGATPVPVPGVWRVVNRGYNSDSTLFVGNISARGDGVTSTNVYASISPDDQQTSQAIMVTPASRIAVINNFSTAINKTGGATPSAIMRLAVQRPGGVFRTLIRYGIQRDGTSNLSSDLIVPIPIPPLSKVKVTAEPTAADTDISAEFSLRFYDEAWLGETVANAIKGI